MRTHTLRRNGNRTSRILTFTPAFEADLLRAHPWASRFLIGRLLMELGVSHAWDQRERMDAALKPVPQSCYNTAMALRWLSSGHRLLDLELTQHLEVLDRVASALFALAATDSPV